MIRLALFIFSVSQIALMSSAHAGSRAICDRLLSSSSLTSPAGAHASSAIQLSPSAQAYVNLILLYVKQSSSKASEKVINKILSANEFVNPFSDHKDTFSIQISAAIEKLRTKIRVDDISVIKTAIQDLLQKNQSENQDRAEKEDETAKIFSPKLIDDIQFDGWIMSSARWQVIKGRTYFTVGDRNNNLYLYELVGEKLHERETKKLKSYSAGAASWQIVGGRVFAAVAVFVGHLYIYELVGERLELLQDIEIPDSVQAAPAWHIIGDQILLMVATDFGYMKLYGLGSNLRLHLITENKVNLEFVRVAWQTVDGRHFAVFENVFGRYYCYELKNKALVSCEKEKEDKLLTALAFKHREVNGRIVKVEYSDGTVFLNEYRNGNYHTIIINNIYDDVVTTTSAWHFIEGRAFVAVGGRDGKLVICEFVGDEFIVKAILSVGGLPMEEPTWQTIGDDVFLAVAINKPAINLYKIFAKLKKGGNK